MNQPEVLGKSRIAVAIPCYNESLTISKVIRDLRAELPDVPIYVFDNNSTDGSPALAEGEGAIVIRVRKQGKGNVMQDIFDRIDADVIVVVDGDDTYYAEDVHKLLEPVLRAEVDMAVGNRLPSADDESMRRLHQFGNRMIVRIINFMFRTDYQDILSGYRIFGKRFIRMVPLLTSGFETETELTLQALERGMDIVEIPVNYRDRPAGSESKLRSFRDGQRIMLTAAMLLRDHHPIRLFGFISLICFIVAGIGALGRIINYLGPVLLANRVFTATIMIFAPLGLVSLAIGLILSAINTRFRELNQVMNRKASRKVGT